MRRDRTGGKQVRLSTYENEPMARLDEQRLRLEGIPSVVRPLGAGPGMWGTAYNLPHALDVLESDVVRAVAVLELPPAELAEREDGGTGPGSGRRSDLALIFLVITIAVVLVIAVPALVRLLR